MTSERDLAILNSVFSCPIEEHLEDEEEATTSTERAKELEVQGVKAAESGNIERAIDIFTRAIQEAPNRPSGYNNRAQAFRLKFDNAAALQDLNKAIDLSGGRGRSACLAYCQRGFLHRLEERDKEALSDFTAAKDLGSDLARTLLAQMNPYAALCNQMLRKVMKHYQ